MALDFTAIQTELFARGFDYLNDAGTGLTRAKRWINEAMHELDSEEQWDYLFASTTGTAPITIADLDSVESVLDVAALNPLVQVDRSALFQDTVDLTITGQALYWYKTAPTIIAVYPVSTATMTVKYYKFGPDLSAGGDAPLVPDRWRQAIVEKAAAKAFRDSNDKAAADDCLAEYARLVSQMRDKMLTPASFMARTHYALDD